jgi:ABC-type ATPase with predicted acetyltransferase domain
MRHTASPIIRIVPIAGTATHRLLRTLAGFGLGVREHAPRNQPRIDHTIVSQLACAASQGPPRIILLQGESGTGKSTHLRATHRALAQHHVPSHLLDLGAWPRIDEIQPAPTTLIDRLPGPRRDALALLSAVGLGDALLMAQSPDTLSEGQSARLRIACAVATLLSRRTIHRPQIHQTPRVLLIDEFASVLDRTNARTLCQSLAKLVRRKSTPTAPSQRLSLVLATAHDDVEQWLVPDLTIHLRSSWEAPTSARTA